ncbi:unnamed protein product [Ixodes persulcatus]
MMKVTLGFFFCSLFCGSLLLLVFVRLCGDFYFPACSAREASNCFVVLYIHIKRWTDGRARTLFLFAVCDKSRGLFFFCSAKGARGLGAAIVGARLFIAAIVRTTHPEPPQRTCREVFALSALLRDVLAGHRTKIGLV